MPPAVPLTTSPNAAAAIAARGARRPSPPASPIARPSPAPKTPKVSVAFLSSAATRFSKDGRFIVWPRTVVGRGGGSKKRTVRSPIIHVNSPETMAAAIAMAQSRAGCAPSPPSAALLQGARDPEWGKPGSILIARDDLAPSSGPEAPPDVTRDRVLHEPQA